MNFLNLLFFTSLLILISCATPPSQERMSDNMVSSTTYNPPVFIAEMEPVYEGPEFMKVNQSKVIQEVQKKLKYLGHNPGSADGVVGPQTSTALIKFQRANGLMITGQLSEATIRALKLDPTIIGEEGSGVFGE